MDMTITSTTQKKLQRLGVVALYLFGSRAQNNASSRSDFDFAVLMNTTGHSRGDKTYDVIYDLLAPLCPRTLDNDIIDIVFLNDAPLELRMHIIRYGKILMDEESLRRSRFEEQTVIQYCDYRPILDMFDRAILASL